jgi:hypothetical protein
MKIGVTPALANDIPALLKMAKEIGATVRVTDGGKTVYIQLWGSEMSQTDKYKTY